MSLFCTFVYSLVSIFNKEIGLKLYGHVGSLPDFGIVMMADSLLNTFVSDKEMICMYLLL